MRFEYTHEFAFPVEEIERLMTHPDIGKFMSTRMPATIIGVEAKERVQEGSLLKRKVHYRPQPLIKSVGPIKVDPRWMEWMEQSTFDLARHEGQFVNTPIIKRIADQMENRGTVKLIPTAKGCKRVLTGELKVKIFMLGAIAERIINSNAEKILKDEAALLSALAASKEL